MNIKKIIREEVDDFDWIRDITPDPLHVGAKFIVDVNSGRGMVGSNIKIIFEVVSIDEDKNELCDKILFSNDSMYKVGNIQCDKLDDTREILIDTGYWQPYTGDIPNN